MADLQSALESCANKEHHLSLETRLEYMEVFAWRFAKEIEAAHAKMVDLHSSLNRVPIKTII